MSGSDGDRLRVAHLVNADFPHHTMLLKRAWINPRMDSTRTFAALILAAYVNGRDCLRRRRRASGSLRLPLLISSDLTPV